MQFNRKNVIKPINLSFLLLTMPLLQVCATSHAQSITINKKNAALTEIFKDIRKQTDYDFIYTNKQISTAKNVDIVVVNASLKQVLDKCFENQQLIYRINDKTITIEIKPSPPKERSIERSIIDVSGTVIDEAGAPLVGAGVSIKGVGNVLVTNNKGEFLLKGVSESSILMITYVGYTTKEISVKPDMGKIQLIQIENKLNQVQIVSTGYQNLPKERATGSFGVINNDLLNRNVAPTILDRLNGVTSGLIFNKGLNIITNSSDITIRGRSTIFANPNPFIVLDNFPYDGDINNIDPNDVESITVLKDAAAASIWGVRAGNGVIVITTKRGKAKDGITVGLNATTTVSDNIDLYSKPQLSSAEFIEMEQFLFKNGYYNSTINNNRTAITPAVAIMLQKRNGQISYADSVKAIDRLKSIDVRRDLEKYVYQKEINQQYSANLNGGGKNYNFYLSTGFLKSRHNFQSQSNERLSLNASQNYKLLNDKLEISTGLLFVQSNSGRNTALFTSPYTPYDEMVDAEGNALPVVRSGGLRKQYTDTVGKGKLLNWDYIPLAENKADDINKLTDYKLNLNLNYKIVAGLSTTLSYQFQKGVNDALQTNDLQSFYTRNQINRFTQLNANGEITAMPVPLGDILNVKFSDYKSNNGRFQLNFSNQLGTKHELNLIAGTEIKDYKSTSRNNIVFGYNDSDASSVPINHQVDYPLFDGTGSSKISNGGNQSFGIDRFVSAYFNGSYTFASKYVFSASFRRDEANIFGVSANQKGVPLWSVGLLWNISKEKFYSSDFFSQLNLRASYGYNGNVDRSTSAYLTARNNGQINPWNAPLIQIVNPPNPALSWEQVRNFTVAVDFNLKHNLFSGSLDYYTKSGVNLIGNSPIAPQTGVIEFKGNSANTRTRGVDFVLNKNAIGSSLFKWQSNLLFNYSKDIITTYKVKQGTNSSIVNNNHLNPLEGYPYYAIFSFPNLGLSDKGMALGMLDGNVSQNYAAILNGTDATKLRYHGSGTPLIFGSLRNTFSYKSFDVSFNLIYKLNYYFRVTNAFSGSNYSYRVTGYDERWKVAGDELKTNVPALTYPLNNGHNNFFQASSALVEPADHVRLQDIKVGYTLSPSHRKFLSTLKLFAYVNNLGIIWKATDRNIDPDFYRSAFVNPTTIALGINTNF